MRLTRLHNETPGSSSEFPGLARAERPFFRPSSVLGRLAILQQLQVRHKYLQLEQHDTYSIPSAIVRWHIDALRSEGLILDSPSAKNGQCYELTCKGEEHCAELFDKYCAEIARNYSAMRILFRERLERVLFHELTRVAVFGIGPVAEFVLAALTSFPEAHPVALVDINPLKTGTMFCRHIVMEPKCLQAILPDVVIVASWSEHSVIIEALKALALPDTVKVVTLW